MTYAIITHTPLRLGVTINIAWCNSVEDAEAYIGYIERTTDPRGVERGEYGIDEMERDHS